MIIGIDVSAVAYGTGVSNYTINLVRNLVKIDKTNQYKLFFSSLRQALPTEIELLSRRENVSVYHYRLPPTLLQIIWNKWHILPIEFLIGKCDVFHTSDWTQPPTIKAKTLCTIHDLTPFLFPKWHVSKVVEAHNNKMRLAVKKAARFICVSSNTREDLLKIFPEIGIEKTDLVFEAAEDKYEDFAKSKDSQKRQKMAHIYKQYDLSNYILAQGTREPRKNLGKLVEAFLKFKNRNPKSKVELAITGKYGWGDDEAAGIRSGVKVLGFIPEKDMVALHAAAIALVYPSLYEGFGLPVLKSMKVGVPVVTSNTSCLPEIAGKAAILVNPNETEEITAAIEKVIKNPTLRKRMIREGFLQASQFSWKKTASDTLKIYETIFRS